MLLAVKTLRPPSADVEARLGSALFHQFLKGLGREPDPSSPHKLHLDPGADTAEVAGLLLRSGLPLGLAAEVVHRLTAALTERPRWVVGAQELWWAGSVVKLLRQTADNQVRVLTAFEAAGWPHHIEDPLGHMAGGKAKIRRRETIKSLNIGLTPRTIRFFSDGTGTGVRWREVV